MYERRVQKTNTVQDRTVTLLFSKHAHNALGGWRAKLANKGIVVYTALFIGPVSKDYGWKDAYVTAEGRIDEFQFMGADEKMKDRYRELAERRDRLKNKNGPK
ncbi:MAG TPA: hypothetical protein VIN59_04710 [Alphaproteobacteria bacterium]